MNTKIFILLACCLSIVSCKSKKSEKDEKVKIAVYYEALCPDSKTFVAQQLYPAWQNLHGAIKVKLVPYGKAIQNKKDGKWEFDCQHGPRECYGNKIQGCALKNKDISDDKKFDLINCLMRTRNPDAALNECATSLSINAEPIETCANSTKGDDILASYGDKTHALNPNLSFVPTVIFNEQYNQENQDQSMSDLKSVICRVAAKKPKQCP